MPKLMKVEEFVVIRGAGKEERAVFQYYDLEGRFLAEYDPKVSTVALKPEERK